MMNQIIIVGAGPTGATLALLMVKQGIRVKLIEASNNFQRAFRGEGLMPSGLDALQQMGLLSIIDKIPHRSLDSWEFLLAGQSLFRIDEPIEAGGNPCTLVSQPHFLNAVVEQASKYSEFELILGQPVRDILYDQLGRVAGVKLGENQKIYADLVIAADGRNSLIRKQAGLKLNQLSSAIDILWFKLAAGSLLQTENTFYSILDQRSGFGLFGSSTGDLHLGWALHPDDDYDWKQVDWVDKLSAASPPWLAQHIQANSSSLTSPLLLSVVVGRCSQWSQPGLLLLGDAVHPLSPIRAQGINMALRDVIVATNYLVPILKQESFNYQEIDHILPQIQTERESEIIRIQQLQNQEIAQAEILRNYPGLRWLVKQFIPLIRPVIRLSWLNRQKQLRQGVTSVQLNLG